MTARAADAAEVFASSGIDAVMNQFNAAADRAAAPGDEEDSDQKQEPINHEP